MQPNMRVVTPQGLPRELTYIFFPDPEDGIECIHRIDARVDVRPGFRLILEDPEENGIDVLVHFDEQYIKDLPIARKGGGISYFFKAYKAQVYTPTDTPVITDITLEAHQ